MTVTTPVKHERKSNRGRKPSSIDKEKFYVNPDMLKAEIAEYYLNGELSESLANSIKNIAEGLSYAPNFINYTYKEDMIGDAIIKMVDALRKKKCNVKADTNVFSYFTTIAFHAFINRIKREKKHRETLNQYQEQVYNDKIYSGEHVDTKFSSHQNYEGHYDQYDTE